jgi:hypothetical protein
MTMQNLKASDHMTGSAKAAINTALSDAKAQRVGGVGPQAAPVAPSAAPSPPGHASK